MRELRPIAAARALIVLAVLLSSPALAADWTPPLPDVLRGSETVVGPPTYPRWEGFYFGGQVGRSFGSAEFSSSNSSQIDYILANTELQGVVSGWTTLSKGTNGGTSYGGFVGYNIQWGEVITGLELNYNHLALSVGSTDVLGPIIVAGAPENGSAVQYAVRLTSSAAVAIHDLMTARARFGWTYDRWLPYGFVGVAVGNAEISRSVDFSGTTKTLTPPLPGTPVTGALILPRNPQSESKNVIAYGFTAGLGLDVSITSNLFLRGEWEYVQFPNINDIRMNVNSVRAGAGLKF